LRVQKFRVDLSLDLLRVLQRLQSADSLTQQGKLRDDVDRFQFPVRCQGDDLWREPQLSRLCANDEPSGGLDLDPLEFSEGVSFDSDYSPEAPTVDVYYWTPEKGSGLELRGEYDWLTSLYGHRWGFAESPGTFLSSFALP